MTFLANKGPALEPFVCVGLVSLLARITKLSWFENPQQDITKDVSQFLTVSVDHCIIGLQVCLFLFISSPFTVALHSIFHYLYHLILV